MTNIEATAISPTRSPDFIPGYRLEQLVGVGGMGEVHKATQLSLGRIVALKLLNPQLAKDESFIARFHKEAAALAALRHPHVVSIVDKGSTDSTYYLVMEYVDGPSLREVMRTPNLDTTRILLMMREICRALAYAHQRGIIHRDLKPENILFDEQAGNIAKVTDFGLASFLDDVSARFSLTSTHVAMGTLAYMAPEQRVDAKSADARADIFSLGIILYEMLVGEVPLGTYDPPSQRRQRVDPRLDAIVARCLKPSPGDRYPSAAELLADIELLIPTRITASSLPLSRLQRFKQGVRRVVRGALRLLEVLLVLTALGVLGVALLRGGERRALEAPGAALTADLGSPVVKSMAGRLETSRESRKVVLGEGPDPVSLLVSGRQVAFANKALVFQPAEQQSRVGRAVVDVVGLEGDIATLHAKLSTEVGELSLHARARALVFGPPAKAEAAVMLLGTTGRYVALIHSGAGAPLKLEWALGERRGTMLGLPSPQETANLELSVDAEGQLRAFVGTGRDRRAIAEPLHLGPDWQKHFGEVPAPALGCIEGTCRAEGFTYHIKRAPPPPPSPEVQPQAAEPAKVVEPPPPAPKPTKRPAVRSSGPLRGGRSR